MKNYKNPFISLLLGLTLLEGAKFVIADPDTSNELLARYETNKDYKQVFSEYIQNGRVTQTDLKPHAFSLP